MNASSHNLVSWIYHHICRPLLRILQIALYIAAIIAALYATAKGLRAFGSPPGEEPESAMQTYENIRRGIALAHQGKVQPAVNAQPRQTRSTWKALQRDFPDDSSGLESQVVVYASEGSLHYRVVIGPYDASLSREFKDSNGWVTLKLRNFNGSEIEGVPQGIRLPLSSFGFVQNNGMPVGWSATGSIPVSEVSARDIERFSLGWMMPQGNL